MSSEENLEPGQTPETAHQRVCRRCGYVLDYLVEHRCPECSTPFAPDDATTYATPRAYARRRRLRLALRLACVVGICLAIFSLRTWIVGHTRRCEICTKCAMYRDTDTFTVLGAPVSGHNEIWGTSLSISIKSAVAPHDHCWRYAHTVNLDWDGSVVRGSPDYDLAMTAIRHTISVNVGAIGTSLLPDLPARIVSDILQEEDRELAFSRFMLLAHWDPPTSVGPWPWSGSLQKAQEEYYERMRRQWTTPDPPAEPPPSHSSP